MQRLVGERPKELITLVGPVSGCRVHTINACMEEKRKRSKTVPMEKRLLMCCGAWTSSGRLPRGATAHRLSERAPHVRRSGPDHVPLSADWHVRTASLERGSRPVGEALAAEEDQQVTALQAQAKQAQSKPCAQRQPQQEIERLYIELDGVLARMRRGSVPLEKEELQRKGDVYREIKAGAVFRAERGSKRSELVPGVYVDTPAPESMRYVARRTAKGGFAWLLYHLAMQCGLEQALQVVVLGDGAPWIWNWSPNTFQGRCRSWISIMPKNMCGTWLTSSLDVAQQRERPGPRTPARSLNKGRVKRSSPRSRRCRPLHRSQGKRAVSQSGPWTTLPPTPSACAIRSSAPKACTSAVASLRPPARPSSAHAPNGAACAGLLTALMRSYLCARLFSMGPTIFWEEEYVA